MLFFAFHMILQNIEMLYTLPIGRRLHNEGIFILAGATGSGQYSRSAKIHSSKRDGVRCVFKFKIYEYFVILICFAVRQWIENIVCVFTCSRAHEFVCSCVEVDDGAARGGDEARARRARAAGGAPANGARGAGLRAE